MIEQLKTEKICKIKSIQTDINENGDTTIEIIIEKGEFGKYLSGIEKDKVIQLFENEINKMIHINDETKLNEFENNYIDSIIEKIHLK